MAPAASTGLPNCARYGLRLIGSAGVAGEAVLVAGRDDPRLDARRPALRR